MTGVQKCALPIYLRTLLNTKNINNIIFGINQLFWGLTGRCIDGKYSFFNEWFVDYVKENNEDVKKLKSTYGTDSVKNIELRIRISQLILELKKIFITRHLTRAKSDIKGETLLECKVLLYQLLMRPLGIPGFFSELKYPGYCLSKIDNCVNVFKIEQLMNEYLNGGKIKYNDPPHINEILPMTLKRLVKLIKQTIYKNEGPPEEQDAYSALNEDDDTVYEKEENKFYHYDKVYTKIPYKLITDYINSDIEVLLDYKEYLDNNYSISTKYFKSEGQHFGNISSDKLIIKMLHDFGYVDVGSEFFDSVDTTWNAP